jgi:hypothetical protein
MVKSLLARKTAPKGWQYFTVHVITHHPETASGYDGKVAAEMNGAETGEDTDRWGWNPLRKFCLVAGTSRDLQWECPTSMNRDENLASKEAA